MIDTEIYTILIVEDNEGLSRLMQINLERSGFKTHIARQIWQARDYIKENLTTERVFMLLDYKLGDTPATELLDELEAMRLHVPFIVVTGKGSEQVAVDMMKRGARDYVVKSTDLMDELLPLLNKIIDDMHREQKRKIYGTPDTRGRQG